MALSAELEALLATVTDATKREAMRKELTEGQLRQDEFSRKMNELSAKTKEWQSWHTGADKEYKEALAEVKTLKQTIAELEKAKAGAVDEGLSGEEDAAITKALKEARIELQQARTKQGELEVAVQGFQKQIADGKLLTAEKFDEEVTKRGDNLGAAIFDIIDMQNQCLTMYGKPLDRVALIAEAQKRGGDLKGAYEFLTKDFATEKIRKDLEAEYEKKYNDRIKAANLPTDQGGGGEPTLGPLQSRLAKKDTGIPDDVLADGTGRLSSLIANELRAEGKG